MALVRGHGSHFAHGHEPGRWQLAIGLALGAGGVAVLTGWSRDDALKNILFKVDPLDPTIYFAVAGLLTLVAALVVFPAGASRHPRRSHGCPALRMKTRILPFLYST
jgi:hypothetical protein